LFASTERSRYLINIGDVLFWKEAAVEKSRALFGGAAKLS
jgi:hypothetical protein